MVLLWKASFNVGIAVRFIHSFHGAADILTATKTQDSFALHYVYVKQSLQH